MTYKMVFLLGHLVRIVFHQIKNFVPTIKRNKKRYHMVCKKLLLSTFQMGFFEVGFLPSQLCWSSVMTLPAGHIQVYFMGDRLARHKSLQPPLLRLQPLSPEIKKM